MLRCKLDEGALRRVAEMNVRMAARNAAAEEERRAEEMADNKRSKVIARWAWAIAIVLLLGVLGLCFTAVNSYPGRYVPVVSQVAYAITCFMGNDGMKAAAAKAWGMENSTAK